MLTTKVGKEIISCIDNKYDRYRLKQWSSKGVLKCPVCDGQYEYCHGEVISPYFRHVGKECTGHYSESETEEHKKGKVILYNWIKKQEGVTNVQLEAWIPETKQRPDIYFEHNGQKCVIEFQCTPIASEFLIRRELYRLAGINDIWILGIEKYAIEYGEGKIYRTSFRDRCIEKENRNDGIFYLSVNDSKLIVNNEFYKIKHNLTIPLYSGESISYFYTQNQYLIDGLKSYSDYSRLDLSQITFDKSITLNPVFEKSIMDMESTIQKKYYSYMKSKSLDNYRADISHLIKELKITNITLNFDVAPNRVCLIYLKNGINHYNMILTKNTMII